MEPANACVRKYPVKNLSGTGITKRKKDLVKINKNEYIGRYCIFHALEAGRCFYEKEKLYKETYTADTMWATRQRYENVVKLMKAVDIPLDLLEYGIDHVIQVQKYFDKKYRGMHLLLQFVNVYDSGQYQIIVYDHTFHPLWIGTAWRTYIIPIYKTTKGIIICPFDCCDEKK